MLTTCAVLSQQVAFKIALLDLLRQKYVYVRVARRVSCEKERVTGGKEILCWNVSSSSRGEGGEVRHSQRKNKCSSDFSSRSEKSVT